MSSEIADAEAEAEADGAGPKLISRGRYSLYQAPDGGLHLAYRPEDADEDAHLVVPPWVIRAAEAAAGGQGPLGRMRALIGFGGG